MEDDFISSDKAGLNQAAIAQEYDINSLRAGAVNGDKIQGRAALCALKAQQVEIIRHGFSFLHRRIGHSFLQ
jgi:hypothetical protein